MYVFLGWLNIGLIAVMTAPYWLRFLNKHTLRLQGGGYARTIQLLRLVHKPLGGAVLLIAGIHGYLALGTLRLHTGTIAATMLVLAAILGTSYFLTRRKPLFIWHKRLVLLFMILISIHLLFPSAVYSLFRI